ncbi:Mfa1 family fimbria major subunit [uncultured Bacteroides sp.]|uniref:Mfa1 family fimbria major subunit n=1 Tax=uncultured Bacteroides sp. TaxID=162156 RepID=UPI0025DAD3AE|nr:Mfa1 family fimbria major subunit [uncultured Bacteroides sp.]
MKTRSFLLSALAALMLAGCSEDAREDEIPGNVLVGKAYLSLSLQSRTSTLTRVDNVKTENGSAEESAVSDVTVLLFDEDEVCLDVVNVPSGDITVGNSDGGTPPTTATASEAQLVPEKTAKVFVVLNSAKWTFTKDAVVGKAWSTINTAIDAVIGDVATNSKFVMASAGTQDNGALTPVTVHKPTAYTASAVQQAKDDAKAHPAIINVDRLSAKVQVSVKDPGFTKPTDSNFTFNGWELSVTNKSVRLYSDLVTYDNATPGAVYRRDKNYLESEQPDISSGNKETNMDAAFNYLKNIDDVSKDMPAVAQVDKASLYCLENTMEAKAQQLGFTTKVVVKAQYTPGGITKDANYFSWKGAYYTLEQLKAEYLKHSDGTGLKVDLPIFLIKAGVMSQTEFDEGQNKRNEIVAGLSEGAAANQLNAKTGIIGRFCAVRYYHESVCYYDVLIRHDQNITTKMALGRYGVVRNNWYNIELNSVSGPGTPWIPDPSDPDPTNPTPPDTDDDEADAYLSVKITINPWTYWSQGVDLH